MEHTSASYRAYRTSGRSAKRNRGNQSGLSPKERVRLVQLCVCLALFLAVFVGKGVFPQQLAQVQNKLVSALTADTDFRAAFSKLGESLGNDGSVLGVYRKTHIPDDHYYQEKFYFTPGDTGFQVWQTRYGKVGVGICWDQWFPESARCMALQGAEMLLYPTAIGSEPILDCDSMPHWRRCMQGHAGCNLMPLVAANRIGLEEVHPCTENGGQSSALRFYGSSFIADETGALVASASRDKEEVLTAAFDLDAVEEARMSWGVFRDRRPASYGPITARGAR